jgi:hypothetical protein
MMVVSRYGSCVAGAVGLALAIRAAMRLMSTGMAADQVVGGAELCLP